MSLFHVNPETGNAGKCSASKGKCPFGGDNEHFTSAEGARAHYEQIQSSKPQLTGSYAAGEPVTYDFPERNLALAEAAIEKANKRLEKAGVPDRFTYELEEYMEENKSAGGLTTVTPRIKFTLNTPSVKYEGYDFLAVVEKAEAGFVVKSATGVNLYGYTPDNLKCDACGKNMGRQKTYLVQDSEGKMLQVGSSCVKNYFGVQPQGLWALTFDPLERAQTSDAWNRATGPNDNAVPTDWVMAYALAVSNGGENFVSGSSAYNYGGSSTADNVRSAIGSSDRKFQEEMQLEAQKYIDNGEAKRLISKLQKNDDPLNSYATNLATIAQGEYTRWGHMNILVSGLSELAREKRAAAKAAHEATWGKVSQGFMAPIGTKLTGNKLKVYKVHHRKEDDPYSYRDRQITKSQVIFRDEDNHEVIWWASKYIPVQEGQVVTTKGGKVTRHGDYNGVDQTVVSALKFEEELNELEDDE